MTNTKQKFETVPELASYYKSFFEIRNRDNGEAFVCLKEDRPQTLLDLVFEAHQGNLPDDWIYRQVKNIIDNISNEYDSSSIEPDIYTHDLINWLRDGGNTYSFDEALEESGLKDFNSICQYAQSREISNIASIIENELERILEEQESEAI